MLMAGVAFLFSLATTPLPTGTRAYGDPATTRDHDGTQCEIKFYGFPLRSVASVEEPCVYGLMTEDKPTGVELGYTYIDPLKVLGNAVLWYVALLLVAQFTRSYILLRESSK